MEHFAGLDVSMEETHICVVDRDGAVVHEAKAVSSAAAIAASLAGAPRVVFETGRMAPMLFRGLAELGIPVICIESRQAYQALKTLTTHKTDLRDRRPQRAPERERRPREEAGDGADSVACRRPARPTAVSTKPPCTQLTPSSADEHAENAGTPRHRPFRNKQPDLDALENDIGPLPTLATSGYRRCDIGALAA